jgi:hypothetical protein
MVPVLRTMAAAVVADSGMGTATPRAHVDLDVPGLQPHVRPAPLSVSLSGRSVARELASVIVTYIKAPIRGAQGLRSCSRTTPVCEPAD